MWAALRPLARDTEPTAEGEASLVPLVSLSSSSSHRTKPSRAVPEDDDIRSTRAEPQESKLKEIHPCETNEKRIFEDFGGIERKRERESHCRGILRSECKTMQRRVEGNRRGLLRGAVVGEARGRWWGEGAASSGRTGPAGPVAPGVGLSFFHSPRGLFPRRWEGRGARGEGGGGGEARWTGGAAYDPARRVPRVSSYTLPRTIDNEPWRTAVVYCREFFG